MSNHTYLHEQAELNRTRAQEAKIAEALWSRDLSVWKGRDEAALKSISTRLGWLDTPESFQSKIAELRAFADDVRAAGFRDAVVLGMGGSSLCVETLRDIFGSADGYPQMHILDSTHPDQVLAIEHAVDLVHTLFIVSSKSGSTLEPNCYHEYFWQRVKEAGISDIGSHFVAITDPGSSLEKVAADQQFRRAFINPSDIGGRFSVLSYFGLLPAAVLGIDIAKLLERAQREADTTRASIDTNEALDFGCTMAAFATHDHDKLTIAASNRLKSFGYWAEQLIAESTGKLGTGIVPVEGESLEDGTLGDDRCFVSMRLEEETPLHPHISPDEEIILSDAYDIGAQFFRWEFAVAVAGWLLEINPFDEPNVAESKANTNNVLAGTSSNVQTQTLELGVGEKEVAEELKDFLEANIRPGAYIAIMAYIERDEDSIVELDLLRKRIEELYQCATTVGFGPRFLHSTGQLHKGGPNEGIFIQLTDQPAHDATIPGRPFTFSKLIAAQAEGDRQSLATKSKPLIHLKLGKQTIRAIGTIASAM